MNEREYTVIAISFLTENVPKVLGLLQRRYQAPHSSLAELSRRAILEILGREAHSEQLDIMAKELGID